MNTTVRTRMIAIAALVAVAGLIGCSDEKPNTQPTPMQKLSQTISSTVAESLIQAVKAGSDSTAAGDIHQSGLALDGAAAPTDIRPGKDMIVIGTNIFAVTDEGIMVYDFVSHERRLIPTERRLATLASHAGTLYAGGDGLFVVEDSTVLPVEIELAGEVTALAGFSYRLLIGTTDGLYSRSIFGDEVMLEDMSITAIVAAGDNVWIGTDGAGLYQFDGVDFRQRYLQRDPSLLDFVTTADFNHDHLYVGTTAGLFVFDGGRWTQYGVADGLPSERISSIDASDWVVIVGTNQGVGTLYDGEWTTIDKLASVNAVSVVRYGRKILVATGDGDVLVKSGPAVRLLLQRSDSATVDVFSALK